MKTNNDKQTSQHLNTSSLGSTFYRKVGAVFIIIALLLIGIIYTLNKLSIETKGTVVAVSSSPTRDKIGTNRKAGLKVYRPVFQFVDNQGVTRQVPISSADSESGYKIGKELMIGYDPDDFSSVRITSWEAHWGFPAFFIGLSLFFFWAARTLDNKAKKQRMIRD